MLQVLRKTIVPRNIRLYFKSSRSFRCNVGSNNSQPGMYSNGAFFMNANLLKRRRYELPHAYSINVRFKHDETGSLIQDHIQEFEAILNTIQKDEKTFTVDVIMSYVNAIRSQLDGLAFEDHHISKLLNDQSFAKLFRAINRSIDQMSTDNLVTTLELCNTLSIPLNSEVCFGMIKQLNNNFEDLSFADKVSFFLFLKYLTHQLEDERDIQKLYDRVGKNILHEIKTKIHLISPENTATALAFVNQYRHIPLDVEKDVLNAVLGLKNWNDSRFFRYFFKLCRVQSDVRICKDLYEKFLTRIQQEEHYDHLHFFLHSYELAVKNNIVDYDRHLVDDIVNKILKSSLKTQQIRSTLLTLFGLKHGHKGFIDFLINFLKRNTYIYVSHPAFSGYIITYLACFSSYVDKNQMEILKSVVKDNPNIVTMLEFKRKYFDRNYLNFIIELATLGIFIDEELNYISGVLERKSISRDHHIDQLFLLNLNQGVKVFHPDFSKPLISSNFISTVLNNFRKLDKANVEVLLLLKNLENLLSEKTGVTHCILRMAMSKIGLLIEGFVAVNSEGQFYDFGVQSNDKRVFIEDISLPADFQLIALVPVIEKQLARNSLCTVATTSFRLKILEALGFPLVILYEPVLRNLSDDEKKNLVHKMILEKVSKPNPAGFNKREQILHLLSQM